MFSSYKKKENKSKLAQSECYGKISVFFVFQEQAYLTEEEEDADLTDTRSQPLQRDHWQGHATETDTVWLTGNTQCTDTTSNWASASCLHLHVLSTYVASEEAPATTCMNHDNTSATSVGSCWPSFICQSCAVCLFCGWIFSPVDFTPTQRLHFRNKLLYFTLLEHQGSLVLKKLQLIKSRDYYSGRTESSEFAHTFSKYTSV